MTEQNQLPAKVPKREVVKWNALKHGILSREAVLPSEIPEEFESLLHASSDHFKPMGSLEALPLEKIAVTLWRLRRAYRYETGVIRWEELNVWDFKYAEEAEKIATEIKTNMEMLKEWRKAKRDLSKMFAEGRPLKDIYDWIENWKWVRKKLCPEDEVDEDDEEETESFSPKDFSEHLQKQGVSDADIWRVHLEVCDERIKWYGKEVTKLKEAKAKTLLKPQAKRMKDSLPPKKELEKLTRYEGSLERQFYKAMNQLERVQRMRAGNKIPAPIAMKMKLCRQYKVFRTMVSLLR